MNPYNVGSWEKSKYPQKGPTLNLYKNYVPQKSLHHYNSDSPFSPSNWINIKGTPIPPNASVDDVQLRQALDETRNIINYNVSDPSLPDALNKAQVGGFFGGPMSMYFDSNPMINLNNEQARELNKERIKMAKNEREKLQKQQYFEKEVDDQMEAAQISRPDYVLLEDTDYGIPQDQKNYLRVDYMPPGAKENEARIKEQREKFMETGMLPGFGGPGMMGLF